MTGDSSKPFSLRRWSERKLAAARARPEVPAPVADALPVAAPGATLAADAHGAPVPVPVPAAVPAAEDAPAALPPVESLTPESDFRPFFTPDVDQKLKRAALRKLFSDPHFNVMDGLDVYIDDYSVESPIEPEVVQQLAHARYLFNPPKTRVTAEGYVEDVPDDEAAEAEASAADAPASSAPQELAAPAREPTPPVPTVDIATPARAGDDPATT